IYQRNVEPGEYVSPGVPLVTLIDLDDLWIHFDLREDLVKTMKIGDRFDVRIPALSDRRITVEVRLIATKGEYASWRATRATGALASAARATRSGEATGAVYVPAASERDLTAERRPQVVAFYNPQYLTAAGLASSGLSDSLAAAASRAATRAAPKPSRIGSLV